MCLFIFNFVFIPIFPSPATQLHLVNFSVLHTSWNFGNKIKVYNHTSGSNAVMLFVQKI